MLLDTEITVLKLNQPEVKDSHMIFVIKFIEIENEPELLFFNKWLKKWLYLDCQFCTFIRMTFEEYIEHMFQYHCNKKLTCPYCTVEFDSEINLLVHLLDAPACKGDISNVDNITTNKLFKILDKIEQCVIKIEFKEGLVTTALFDDGFNKIAAVIDNLSSFSSTEKLVFKLHVEIFNIKDQSNHFERGFIFSNESSEFLNMIPDLKIKLIRQIEKNLNMNLLDSVKINKLRNNIEQCVNRILKYSFHKNNVLIRLNCDKSIKKKLKYIEGVFNSIQNNDNGDDDDVDSQDSVMGNDEQEEDDDRDEGFVENISNQNIKIVVQKQKLIGDENKKRNSCIGETLKKSESLRRVIVENIRSSICRKQNNELEGKGDSGKLLQILDNRRCPLCNKFFTLSIPMRNHLESEHFNHVEEEQQDVVKFMIDTWCCKNDGNKICKICKKSFIKPYFLRKHLRAHCKANSKGKDGKQDVKSNTEKVDRTCDICKEVFIQPYFLKKHMRVHYKLKEVRGNKIEEKIKQKSEKERSVDLVKVIKMINNGTFKVHETVRSIVQRNILTKSKRDMIQWIKPRACQLCDRVFDVPCRLRRHMSIVHFNGKKLPWCKLCGMAFENAELLNSHKGSHKKTESADCTSSLLRTLSAVNHDENTSGMCNVAEQDVNENKEKRKMSNGLLVHPDLIDKIIMTPSHLLPEITEQNEEGNSCSKSLYCTETNQDSASQILDGSKTKAEKLLYSCRICEERLINRRFLLAHLEIKHGANLKCKVCDKSFKFRCLLRRHLKYFHQKLKKKNHCILCSDSFEHKQQYNRHLRDSHWATIGGKTKEDYNYQCLVCFDRADSIDSLKEHMDTHLNDPEVIEKVQDKKECSSKCYVCGVRSRNRKNLAFHIYFCHKQMPLFCAFCNEKFWSKATADVHVIETHPWKFKCEICGEGFPSIQKKGIHFGKKHAVEFRLPGSKLYKCKYCEKTCSSVARIFIHMQKHKKEKEIKCDLCSAAFKRQVNLERHKVKMHSKYLRNKESSIGIGRTTDSSHLSDKLFV